MWTFHFFERFTSAFVFFGNVVLFLFLVHYSFHTLVCFGFVSMSFYFFCFLWCCKCVLCVSGTPHHKAFQACKTHTKGFFYKVEVGVLGAHGVVYKTYKNIQGLGKFIALPNDVSQ
jgi:hypothetical protein